MFCMPASQAFRMKLDAQKERQPVGDVGFQLDTLNQTIPADRHRLQRLGDPTDGLVVRAVHGQFGFAGYLGQ
jgi:hypothetical protein